MLRQLLVGGAVSLANIAIHALAMTMVISATRLASTWRLALPQLQLIGVMITTVGVLLVAHVVEVVMWSLTYALLDVAQPDGNVLYFAFVNYTTLGYGDIVPVERWSLLGPLTAMNGVLLFGWSTAVIVEALRQTLHSRPSRDRG